MIFDGIGQFTSFHLRSEIPLDDNPSTVCCTMLCVVAASRSDADASLGCWAMIASCQLREILLAKCCFSE